MNFVRDALDGLGNLPGRLWRGLVRARMVGFVVVLVAGAVALSLASVSRDDGPSGDGDREGSVVVDEHPTEPLAPVDPPTEYRIVYAVADGTETVVVRRPFSGRLETASGTVVSVFGSLGSDGTRVAIPPVPAIGDNGFAAAASERSERRRMTAIDRECDVYRVRSGSSSVDVCVDASRLVLETYEVIDDKPPAHRVAIELDVSPAITADTFDLPGTEGAPAHEGGGSTLAVDATTRPPVETWYELSTVPAGFTHRGRYEVIPPDNTVATADWPENTTSVVDVWVNGPVFFAVDQGGTRGRTPPFSDSPRAEAVTVAGFDGAEFVAGVRWSEVRADLGEGRYVRVYGTVDRETLLRVARSLAPVEGDELVYLDN
ncbi:MAG TPA: hypothetical protein VI916_06960 [Acidimicrobiia bacterium]|nr:hypothetical protein [Acidimicrobiia bacterium]